MADTVSVTLTRDEALVLFEWLAQRADSDVKQNPDDFTPLQAEELVLSRIHGILETWLTEVFDPAYAELVAAARNRVSNG